MPKHFRTAKTSQKTSISSFLYSLYIYISVASQIALHTSVVYTHNFQSGRVEPISVFTVSDCVRHDASAIWAHLTPLIQLALEENPFTTTLYFLSDSPTSQYRNKFIFYMISQFHYDFLQLNTVIWNYSEKGHRKGAPDGVGAVLKRTADAAVKYAMYVKNIIIIPVSQQNIREKEKKYRKMQHHSVEHFELLASQAKYIDMVFTVDS